MQTREGLIRTKAIEILKGNSQGVRYSKLANEIKRQLPNMSIKTIYSAIWNLEVEKPNEVYKASRGLFRHVSFRESPQTFVESTSTVTPQINEVEFYKSFADYLVKDLEECTKAKSLGGNVFKDKWGTPDVIGIEKSKPSDIVKHEVVIVSAEIKTDTQGLITAFGQACAYKLFSHKTYIVIPKSSSEEDKSRLESLSLIFGIGLIFFDSANTQDPQWEIRVRPQRHEPDMFYVNKYMKMKEIEEDLFD
jgi:hypothetical protein